MKKIRLDDISKRQKAEFLTGENFWQTKPIYDLEVLPLFLTDGPHGVRKQKDNLHLAMLNNSFESTAFPTLSCVASSWDVDLIKKMGEAIGKEANEENVDVLLGPGMNIKRMPTCGRNFEYLSEDPYLSGKLAASYVQGVQSTGVSACLKHFVCSNMEEDRMVYDVLADERALREIYLRGFEIAVKESSPNLIMSAYNKLNGVYCSENKRLLTDILRTEWGFSGAVVSDWGAVNDPVKSTNAGLSLEMPRNKRSDHLRVAAVNSSEISEETLNARFSDVMNLYKKSEANANKGELYVASTHHELARKIASESMVLLKNDNVLPFDKNKKYLVVGNFAKKPVIQGAGSSLVNPTSLDTVYEELSKRSIDFVYADYHEDKSMIETMLSIVDGVIIFAGLDSSLESESFDRENLRLPFYQERLINLISQHNENTVLVITSGAPVTFDKSTPAIIQTYLAGQAVAPALLDILFGDKSPSGKLAETYPEAYDVPSHMYYNSASKQVKYLESIYVGYRYYDKNQDKILFPFGHGLTYTSFEYSNLKLESSDYIEGDFKVSFDIENTGEYEGREVAQIYVRDIKSTVYKPIKELKGFKKVKLKPGEKQTVEIVLDNTSFEHFDVEENKWVIEPGEFEILVGASSLDIRLQEVLCYKKEEEKEIEYSEDVSVYHTLDRAINDEDFEAIYGDIPDAIDATVITLNSSLDDIKDTFFGRKIVAKVKREIEETVRTNNEDDPTYKMLYKMQIEMPLRVLSDFSNGALSHNRLLSIIAFSNKKYFKGTLLFIQSIFNRK